MQSKPHAQVAQAAVAVREAFRGQGVKQPHHFLRMFRSLHARSQHILAMHVPAGGQVAPQLEVERMLLGYLFHPCLRAVYAQLLASGGAPSDLLREAFAIQLLRSALSRGKGGLLPCFRSALSALPPQAECEGQSTANCMPVQTGDTRFKASAMRTRVVELSKHVVSFAPGEIPLDVSALLPYGESPRWSDKLRDRVRGLAAGTPADPEDTYAFAVRHWGGLVHDRRAAEVLLTLDAAQRKVFHALWEGLDVPWRRSDGVQSRSPARYDLDVLCLISTQTRGDADKKTAAALRRRVQQILPPEYVDVATADAMTGRALRWGRIFRWATSVPATKVHDADVRDALGVPRDAMLSRVVATAESGRFGQPAVRFSVGAEGGTGSAVARAAAAIGLLRIPFLTLDRFVQAQGCYAAPGYLWQIADAEQVRSALALRPVGVALETAMIDEVTFEASTHSIRLSLKVPSVEGDRMRAVRRVRPYVILRAPSREWIARTFGDFEAFGRKMREVDPSYLYSFSWAPEELLKELLPFKDVHVWLHSLSVDTPLPPLELDDEDLRRFLRIVAVRVLERNPNLSAARRLERVHELTGEDVAVHLLSYHWVRDPVTHVVMRAALKPAVVQVADDGDDAWCAVRCGPEVKLPKQYVSSKLSAEDVRDALRH